MFQTLNFFGSLQIDISTSKIQLYFDFVTQVYYFSNARVTLISVFAKLGTILLYIILFIVLIFEELSYVLLKISKSI